jgi:hypothetical protein
MPKKIIENLLYKDYSFVMFVIFSLFMTMSVFFNVPILLLSAVVVFSSMDAIGFFHLVWGGKQFAPAPNQEERLVSYRFIQTVFQATLTMILYLKSGPIEAMCFNLMWWFGLCDLLYYFLLRQKFIHYTNMYWLWWTPAGMLKTVGILKTVSGTTLVIQSVIGIIISLLVIFYQNLF